MDNIKVNNLTIDYDKCVGCLKCTRVCIWTIIEARGGKPYVLEDKYGCAKCMHCGIVCPEGAIRFDGAPMMAAEDKPIVSDTFMDDIESFLLTRRSYRDFREEEVDSVIIRRALETAAWAPSAKNQHPTKYFVVQGREKVDAIMDAIVTYLKETGENPEILSELKRGNNLVLGHAQTLILAYSRNNAINPQVDTALALDYADLCLQSRGLGTCWAGYLTRFLNKIPALQEMFPLPKNNSFYGALLVGWPKEDYLYIPQRLKRADITFV
ncbi:MAG: nitroreductase family protein [Firmicutes bacterium]|nr:nitroreductase family protein [Bacillota bacterium]